MESYAYYNGDFGRRCEIKIPLSDRSIFFGDGVYDAAVGRYEFIMWEKEHIQRFLINATRLGIEHSYTPDFLSSLLREIAIRSCIPNYFLYLQISRNATKRNHSAMGCSSNLLVTIEPFEIQRNSPPMCLIAYPDLRYGYCDVKTVNLLPSVLSATEAERRGCDEAVFIRKGTVTECSKSNIAILKGDTLFTHPLTNRILPGIARRHLLLACRKINISVIEMPFTLRELKEADEVLISSTTKLVRRACELDGMQIGMKNSLLAEKLSEILYEEYKNLGKN